MANTYSQIYIQIVFAVQNRKSLIKERWENELFKYITGIISQKGQKLIAINGVSDHIHIFIGMKPNCCLSDLVREIKKSSTAFINDKKFTTEKFKWQEGFGSFSYSHSHIPRVAKYIENQKEHHRKKTFREEYLSLLKAFEVDYNEIYVFDWLENEG